MLELLKRSERTMKLSKAFQTYRTLGGKIKNVGEYTKWKELRDGKISVTVNIYEIILDTRKFGGETIDTFYMMEDSLGMAMLKTASRNLEEIKTWLKDHNYKTTKNFYLEDYGMDEETWNEWNK